MTDVFPHEIRAQRRAKLQRGADRHGLAAIAGHAKTDHELVTTSKRLPDTRDQVGAARHTRLAAAARPKRHAARQASRRRRLRVGAVAALGVALAGVVVPAAPASAEDWTVSGAVRACQARAPADLAGNGYVDGRMGGTIPAGVDPANIIHDGDVVQIVPGDVYKVKVDNWPWGPSYGPGGNGTMAPSSWPFPLLNEYSAVLNFNNNPSGWVGQPHSVSEYQGCRSYSGPPARLIFYPDDPNPGDNSGYWVLQYRIWLADLH